MSPRVVSRSFHVTSLLTAVLALAVLTSGCGGTKRNDMGFALVKSAKNYVGIPYVYGGRSKKGVDCSGLTLLVFREHGVELPNASYKQVKAGVKIGRGELEPGDLIFFHSRGRVNHVGIYVGKNQMIHAPGKGRKVCAADLDVKYYRDHYHSARRVYLR